MKVLFLDVDGVLVHSGSVEGGRASGEPCGSSFYYAAQVDPACGARVKRIVEETGARIVVSSTWRRFEAQMSGLRRALLNAGFDRRTLREVLVGSTPTLGGTGLVTAIAQDRTERQMEVEAWLAQHPEITSYLVIDDHPLPGHPQLEPRPDYFGGGLLEAHIEQATRILGIVE